MIHFEFCAPYVYRGPKVLRPLSDRVPVTSLLVLLPCDGRDVMRT